MHIQHIYPAVFLWLKVNTEPSQECLYRIYRTYSFSVSMLDWGLTHSLSSRPPVLRFSPDPLRVLSVLQKYPKAPLALPRVLSELNVMP